MLFQIVTIGCVMAVIPVEAVILILRVSVGISFQLSGIGRGFLVFNLH